ncbi:MAG: ATP-binding cassette domain-containing protein [Theionarchaea archaeon]|nr:ATP-binding cassette domain-containing protein [Theionarchaea archaeon]
MRSGVLFQHAAVSLARVLAGFLLAVAIGLPLGVLMGWSPRMEDFSVIIEMLRPIPPLAWIPLAMLWFGIGFQSKAFIIFIGAFFPILSNALLGVRETEPYLVEAGRVLGASDSQILKKIILPNSFPSILEGLRIDNGSTRSGPRRHGDGWHDRHRSHRVCHELCSQMGGEQIGEVEAMISLEYVTKTIGELPVLKAISLSVKKGQFVCLVGPSGCGKTTLLKCIAGLRTYEGEIRIDGKVSQEINPKIGYVFQEFSLFPFLTVRRNMEFGLEIQKTPKKERDSIVKSLLDLFLLQGFEDAYPHELSGGMQKKVAIARAIATDPEILLMDEPFVSLDAQTRNMLQKELLRIWHKTHKTVLFVTHNVDEAVFLADRVMVLTRRPASVKSEFSVDLKRERDRTSPEFVSVRKEILSELEEEYVEQLDKGYKGL